MTTATKERRKIQNIGTALAFDDLFRAVIAVDDAVPARSTKPILGNVLLYNGGLTGTDLELQVSAEVAYVGDPILLPHARLLAILRAASGDEVTLAPNGSACVVTVGGGTWTLPTEDAAEFPRWEPTGIKRICTIPADQFVRAVKAVAYATDNDSSRFSLGAVLLEVERSKGVVHFVGTDGRRLSEYKVELSNNEDPDDSTTLIPARAILTISSIASHSEGAVQLEATANEVVATIDGTVVTAKLLVGRFPKWRDTIPERDVKATVVSGPELLAATRQAAIVTSEQSKGVTYSFVENGIFLNAKSSEAGESAVTCGHMEAGATATVAMDPHFVADFLKAVDPAEPVEVEAVDAQSAVVLRCGDCTGVIMPLAKD
jgi:DNA polymerase-3 subunit beta